MAAGQRRLAAGGVDSPRLDAELLLADALGTSAAPGWSSSVTGRAGRCGAAVRAAAPARGRREPVAYILGRRDFRRLTLAVDPRVLIPRPETELLVEVGLALPAGARVIDVGTGSGAVALALADERPDLVVRGTDVSADALAVARANAGRLGLDVGVRGAATCSTVRPADAVLANLPYVSEGGRWRPRSPASSRRGRCSAGPDGLDVVRRLIGMLGTGAAARARCLVALEIDPEQAAEVAALAGGAGFTRVESPGSGRARPRGGGSPMTEAEAFERCMSVGGVAVFPADTVYGLACDVHNRVAVERLYRLKRPAARQALGGDVLRSSIALDALPELGGRGPARRSSGCCRGR